jgi:hypothetical protein
MGLESAAAGVAAAGEALPEDDGSVAGALGRGAGAIVPGTPVGTLAAG